MRDEYKPRPAFIIEKGKVVLVTDLGYEDVSRHGSPDYEHTLQKGETKYQTTDHVYHDISEAFDDLVTKCKRDIARLEAKIVNIEKGEYAYYMEK